MHTRCALVTGVQTCALPLSSRVEIIVRHDPPWTSEWMSEPARQKLKAAGLAPPPHHHGNLIPVLLDPVACPGCNSTNTTLRNRTHERRVGKECVSKGRVRGSTVN